MCKCGLFSFCVLCLRRLQKAGRNCLHMKKSGLCSSGVVAVLCFVYNAGVQMDTKRQIMSKWCPRFLRFLWAFVLQSIAPAAVPYNMTHFQHLQFSLFARKLKFCLLSSFDDSSGRGWYNRIATKQTHCKKKITHAQMSSSFVSCTDNVTLYVSFYEIHRFYSFGIAFSSFRPLAVSRFNGRLPDTTFLLISSLGVIVHKGSVRNAQIQSTKKIKSRNTNRVYCLFCSI